MPSFRDLLYPPITKDGFDDLRDREPKRICFGSTHQTALKKATKGSAAGFLNVPFTETIGTFLPWDLFPNTKGSSEDIFESSRTLVSMLQLKTGSALMLIWFLFDPV